MARAIIKKLFRKLLCRHGAREGDEEYGADTKSTKSEALIDNSTANTPAKRQKTKSTSKKQKTASQDDGHYRYFLELNQRNLFTIREEVSGKYIDVLKTFTPKPKWWMVVVKLVIFAWVAYVFVREITHFGNGNNKNNYHYPRAFFFATFDHWALIITMIYLWFSFLCNALRKPSKSVDEPRKKYLPRVWHKITWSLFAVALPSQIFATLAFWIFDFYQLQGNTYTNTMQRNLMLQRHGSVLILLFVEGLCLNRTPIRINHQWFFFGFVYSFLLWSLIHYYTGIGNPHKSRTFGDNALYPFLHWESAPLWTVLHVILILFIVNPLIYWIVWMLSLFSFPFKFQGKYRHYLSKEDSKALEKYVEEPNET